MRKRLIYVLSAIILVQVLICGLLIWAIRDRRQEIQPILEAAVSPAWDRIPEEEILEPPEADSELYLPEPSGEPEVEVAESELTEEDVPIEVTVDETLQTMMEQELATCTGTWTMYYKNLDTGEMASVGAQQPMVAASLIKLFVAGAYCEAVEMEEIPDDHRSDVWVMLSQSSDDACNRLIDLLGMARINVFIETFGVEHSVLNRKMMTSGEENYTSAEDCGLVLEAMMNGTYVSPEVSEMLLGYLRGQYFTSKIPAGVPEGVETANKTGDLSTVSHDVAIVWSPAGTYILCVLSNDIPSRSTAESNIVGISRMVYEYLNG